MTMRWWRRRPGGRWGGSVSVPRRTPGSRTAAELGPGFRRGTTKSGLPRLGQRSHAAGAVEVAAVGQAGVDIGDDRLATAARRVEIGIEHTGGSGELELARRTFADVEVGLAELGFEI